ncbi:MAG: cellulose biosynthesis cyclic di-GMP-binding regulatory protein BcsB [Bacillota bacterium]
MIRRIKRDRIMTLVLVVFLSYYLMASDVKAGEIYTNQVGKFNYYSNAVRLKENLEGRGFKVYMSEGPPYVVTVERSLTYLDALRVRDKLKGYNIDCFIVKIEEEGKITIIEESDIKALNIFPLLNDSILQGVHGSQTLFFYVNENWEPEGSSYVDLYFSHSPVSTNHKSTLTVFINDRPVSTLELINEKAKNRAERVYIPKEIVEKGFNALTLRLYKRISDEPCEDAYNPGNWFTLKRETMIHLEYKEVLDSTNLSNYPYPYFKIGREDPIDSLIVIPKDYNQRHLNAAAYLAAGFGKYEPYKNIRVKVATEQEIKGYLNDSNLIFIGSNSEFKDIDGLPSAAEKGAGVLEKFISPWNPSKRVLRIAGEGEYIQEASKALFYANVVNQMKRSRQVIKNLELLTGEIGPFLERVTLADMGYNDIIVRGKHQQAAAFSYSLPTQVELKEGAGITLNLRYSQALQFIQASATVEVNNIPLGSRRLTYEGAEGEQVFFKFPPELLREKNFDIRVLFNLDLRDIDCTQRYEEQAWAVIGRNSFLHLPHEEGNRKNLKNYHYIFSKNSRIEDTVAVIPDNPRLGHIETALNIFVHIGHYLKDLGDIGLVKAGDLTDDQKDKNMIFIGTPEENSYIKTINQYLPVKFDENRGRFIPNNDFPFLEELGNEVGIVQLIDSPWSSGKKVMVVTGADYFALKNAEIMLTSLNIANTLSGVVCMMDNAGEVYSFESVEKADTIQKNKEDKSSKLFWFQRLHELLSQRNVKILAVILGLIITTMIILFYVIKKN